MIKNEGPKCEILYHEKIQKDIKIIIIIAQRNHGMSIKNVNDCIPIIIT